MKRVERRGTLESQQLAAQQQQQMQTRMSQSQIPISTPQQSSDRSLQRSDTIANTQTPLGPSSYSQAKLESFHQPNQRVHTASSTASFNKANSRQAPTPPAIAALHDKEDDEDNDPEQLPTSNVGRGTRTRNAAPNTHGRASPKNGRLTSLTGNGNGHHAKKSSLSTSSKPSGSPRMEVETDEMDADADADADAEAEAEILHAVDAANALELEAENADGDGEAEEDAELLEAVDAAEANSSSSQSGERNWTKAEA